MLSVILKTGNKTVVTVLFFDMWKYIHSESLFNTLYMDGDITQMLKKFLSDKINVEK